MDQEYQVAPEEVGQRLDVFCVQKIPTVSRATIQKAIKEGRILVNGVIAKPRLLLKNNNVVQLKQMEVVGTIAPAPIIDIPILYEDRDIVVVNKPAGVNVHPGHDVGVPTITAWFIDRYPDNLNIGDPARPGVVHRLDKETSGVVVLAKTSTAFVSLKEQFKLHRIKKEYLGWVFGVPGGEEGRITRPLSRSRLNPMRRMVDPAGKPAITEWRIEARDRDRFALLRIFPYTGRTHQIRVHLHFLGHPIVGDRLYNFKRQRPPQGVTRHLLHAEKLTVVMLSGKKAQFIAPVPADFSLIKGVRYDARKTS